MLKARIAQIFFTQVGRNCVRYIVKLSQMIDCLSDREYSLDEFTLHMQYFVEKSKKKLCIFKKKI
jgi:hypothetical protein